MMMELKQDQNLRNELKAMTEKMENKNIDDECCEILPKHSNLNCSKQIQVNNQSETNQRVKVLLKSKQDKFGEIFQSSLKCENSKKETRR